MKQFNYAKVVIACILQLWVGLATPDQHKRIVDYEQSQEYKMVMEPAHNWLKYKLGMACAMLLREINDKLNSPGLEYNTVMRFHQAPPCSDWREDDGKDPRYDSHANPPKLNRKALQLCAQVQQILNMTLPYCGEEALEGVYVESVLPNPDSMHMMVRISGGEPTEVLAALHKVGGYLRSEVAQGIHRKKVPELKFAI